MESRFFLFVSLHGSGSQGVCLCTQAHEVSGSNTYEFQIDLHSSVAHHFILVKINDKIFFGYTATASRVIDSGTNITASVNASIRNAFALTM